MMIIVEIDAPAVRSLSEGEKQVYQKLKNGDTPLEIAKALRMPCKANYSANMHDAPVLSVESIITSIHEKGWEIPSGNNKEDITEMPKGVKLPEEAVKAVEEMAKDGKSISEICRALKMPYTSVHNIVEKMKKEEPAPEATDTSPEPEQNISTDSISCTVEDVKPDSVANRLVCEVLGRELQTRAFELTEKFEAIQDKLREAKTLIEERDFMAAEYDVIYAVWKRMRAE